MPKDKVKVMIVDDHLVVREGLKQLLEINQDVEVVAEADSGLACLSLLEKIPVDVILMDVRMPGIGGIETTRIVCQKYPQAKVVMLTIYDEDQFVTEAIEAGAKGYVLKKVGGDELIKIIHHVMEDHSFLDPKVTSGIFNRIKRRPGPSEKPEKPQFTHRELEILKCLVEGLTDREIAESLCISTHTVRSHLKSIFRKLGATSRSQAVARAIYDKIIHQA